MQPIDNDQSDEKNSNPPFLNVNSARYSIDKWKQKPAIFEQNIAKKSGGSPAVKPPTMHGFKRYNSSANPSDQVFIKDNEPVISQFEFIETVVDAVKRVYPREQLLNPIVRVSHPVQVWT